jgi:Outer membrane protein beta-barrel domain
MKRLLLVIPAMLLCCLTAKAQETPAWELSGGASYLESNISGSYFGLPGGGGAITENLNSWFGGRAEVNAYHGVEAGTTVSVVTANYGPVFSFRKFNAFTPFANAQFGVIHGSQGYLGISQSAFKFGMVGGGGIDVRINDQLAVRGQANYLLSRFYGLQQNNLTFGVGLVFKLGHK